ncbi:fimbrillin family protein, partial [Bacteroides timonensis]|uniref:fimbrillin family protein n=1 Tax=Bacteroides timonensis TaxID=1470345 RepID=UPI0005C6B3F5
MKKNILNISLFTLLSAVVLCGCSNDDELTVAATDGTTLTVTARADGFASTDGTPQTGTPQTRASESGYTTTFVKDDQIGVFAVKNGSVITDCKNVPLTYDGEKWNGNVIYKYAGATYFAYYPYSESMNDKTSVDAIVTAFNNTVATVTDQSTYANYTACDLMTASVDAASVNGKSLSFTFSHAMSLIEISLPVQKYKTSEAADAYEYSAPVSAVTFSLTPSGGGAATIKPCPMDNGAFRYIVPAGTSGATVSGAFNIADGKTIEYSKSSLSLSAGYYKRLNVTYSGANTAVVRALAVGDFYYSDGNICLGDASNPPSEGCIGVVYCVDNSFITEKSTNKSEGGFIHGLVVALKDASTSSNWDNDNAGSAASNYGNTVAAPSGSSGWYLPNLNELKYICWGNNSIQSTSGKNNLNTQFNKLSSGSADVFGDDFYWSSTESNIYSAYGVHFSNGYADWYVKSRS